MTAQVASARRPLVYGHIPNPEDTTRTVCGQDLTDTAELWQPIPADVTVPTCPPCLGEEELTLL